MPEYVEFLRKLAHLCKNRGKGIQFVVFIEYRWKYMYLLEHIYHVTMYQKFLYMKIHWQPYLSNDIWRNQTDICTLAQKLLYIEIKLTVCKERWEGFDDICYIFFPYHWFKLIQWNGKYCFPFVHRLLKCWGSLSFVSRNSLFPKLP